MLQILVEVQLIVFPIRLFEPEVLKFEPEVPIGLLPWRAGYQTKK